MTDDGPDIAFFPPAGLLAAILAASALEWLIPLDFLPPPLTLAILLPGILLMAAGIGLALWGDRRFKRPGPT